MEINFEVYKIPPIGIPTLVEQFDDLKSAITSAVHLAVSQHGHYTVRDRHISEPILELWNFEAASISARVPCLTN
jgi:hypothetical protein